MKQVARLLAVAGVLLGVVAAPVQAAGVQSYAAWTLAGANPAWTGTATIAAAAGFPAATFATNSLTPTVPTGASTWLGPTTPFGAVFGSSQGLGYLVAGTTTSVAPSSTTFTFAGPTPVQSGDAGWGFALGDIDADTVAITAVGADGTTLTAAQLGWQSAFNYCNVSPKPTGCPGGTSTDVPTWDPATSTLVGNGSDTGGAAGWFRPTVPVTSITFAFTPLTGFPSFQVWVAASATLTLAGTVTLDVDGVPSGPVADAIVELLDGSGEPVTVGGVAVTTTTAADGTYSFGDLVPAADYTVRISTGSEPGEGDVATVPVNLSQGSVDDADAVISRVTPPTPSTSSSTSSTSSTTTTSTIVDPTTTMGPVPPVPGPPTPGAPAQPSGASVTGLPATGAGVGGLVALAGPLLVAGAALAGASRRRRPTNPG